jgi:hypothetical protein
MTREQMTARAESLVGTPFKRLPGDLPGHGVLGRASDGTRLTVEAVEMVMNDAYFIDSIRGAGEYAASCQGDPRRQLEAYALAVKLYGCEPIDLHGKYSAGIRD